MDQRLPIVKWFVIIFSLLTILFFLQSITGYYDVIRTECVLKPCSSLSPAPPTTLKALQEYHLTPDSYAGLFVFIETIFALLFYVAAVIIFIKNRQKLMGLLAVLSLVAYGTTYTSLVYLASEGTNYAAVPEAIGPVGRMALFLFFLLFPNGRLVKKWTLFVFIPFCAIQIVSLSLPNTSFYLLHWPSSIRLAYYLTMMFVTIYSQIYQYKNISSTIQRQQTKWVVYGFAISLIGSIIVSGFFVYPVLAADPIYYVYLSAFLYTVVAIIPLTLSFAVMRHRLWEIDPLVNRTIVYGLLSLSVILLYSFLVMYFSSLFKTDHSYLVSFVATAIVAVVFSPLKERLQRIVNRFLKGRHDDPYSILQELGEQLIKPIAPEQMLDVVIETIQNALRLPYTSITVGINGKETIVIEAGKLKFDLHSFPIVHGGEELGTLHLSSRSAGEAFSPEDDKLIEVLLRQTGPILQNAKMTLGMKLLAKDLQASREKLVVAREEERLTIRRNLHDELAPKLMSLAFNVAAAEQYIEKNPVKAKGLLESLRQVIRQTVEEIRTMVHGLRPATLDEFGLLGAIRVRVNEIKNMPTIMGAEPLQVILHVPDTLPVLPAAVEVAAYRIITESLVNVKRHSKASTCSVFLKITATYAQIEITDNGIGMPEKLKPAANGGIGLTSIRERAMELGGSCEWERVETGGTRVKAMLPLTLGGYGNENEDIIGG
ncbi:histidine kinase [Neobacillus sp. LXY-1]|uniref:GAF domain-containing sensor histidine kinase n=1 Tax=Neobacillus sp. LXY-1 TaxID=3379133 RepID=UPI003EE38CBF